MSRKYKISDQEKLYFVTFTVIDWIDVFIRDEYRSIIIDSIKYCQKNKSLEVYGYCIMTSHVHMIIGTSNTNVVLEGIIRDMKVLRRGRSELLWKTLMLFMKAGESGF